MPGRDDAGGDTGEQTGRQQTSEGHDGDLGCCVGQDTTQGLHRSPADDGANDHADRGADPGDNDRFPANHCADLSAGLAHCAEQPDLPGPFDHGQHGGVGDHQQCAQRSKPQ